MDSFIVYSQDGKTERCILNQLEYNGEFMGACSVTFSISSPTPIEFQIGDYLIYREERFELNYIPTELKKSSKGTNGESFNYQDVQFNSLSDELVRCSFLDYVVGDNLIHYSSLPVFSFYAESINALAERIQVNLDRIYKSEKKWTVTVHPEYVNVSNKNITVDNISVWDALALANSEFKTNFTIKGRTITIGTAGIAIGKLFSYGKGNGLYSIQKTAEEDQGIITRLRAYGSTRNMPNRYYNKLSGSSPSNYLPNNMAVENLMLPDFPKTTLDPYIDSPNISTLGIREGSVYFDGSGDLEEIYPSMEGITADQLRAAGISISLDEGDNGNLDEVADAEQLTDDGTNNEDTPTFTITLKDIGFNISDYQTSEAATISMKSGMCGGREFEIAQCEKVGNKYVLTCNRSYDESLKLYFPYKGYNISSGDEFVLLNIDMPDVYIQAASQRLLTAAKDYLAKNDYVRYSYEPKVDDIFMARQHEEATSRGEKSIHDTLKEGDLMLFEDTDLNINGSVIIQSLTINEGKSSIPSYEIILRNDKTVGTLEKIQNQIDSLSSGQGRGGFTTQQIESIIRAFGNKIFLSKTTNDRTPFKLEVGDKLTAEKGLQIGESFVPGIVTGSGGFFDKFANGEVESLIIRRFLEVPELRFNRVKIELGDKWNAPGAGIFESVEPDKDSEGNPLMTGTGYLKLEEGEYGAIAVGDICMGIFHSENPSDNASSDSDDSRGNFMFAGFYTCYFTITEITGSDNKQFRYQLRPVSDRWKLTFHPSAAMHFVSYGSFTDESRQTSQYTTRTYTRMLWKQNTWEISSANIAMQYGDLSNMSIHGLDMVGYSMYLNSVYFTGRIKEVKPDGTPIYRANDRGAWVSGTKYDFYDRVSHNGSIWLCVNEDGTNSEPAKGNPDWLLQVEKGDPGESAVFADLTNQMDNVTLTNDGKVYQDTSISTVAWMSYGSKKMTLTGITCTLPANVTETHDVSTGEITFSVKQGVALDGRNPIPVALTATYNGKTYTGQLTFTMAGVKGGADAVLYRLVPSVSAVIKDANGNLNVTSVSCTRLKSSVSGGTAETGTGELKYSLDGGAEVSIGNNAGVPVSSFQKSIKFIFYVDGTVVDVETIPLVVDGKDGAQGPQGVPGPAGADGKTLYTWIKYADDAQGGGISNNPTGKAYIGFAYNKETATESNNPSDYTWSDIKGEDGIPGATGADGKTYYTWVAYSDNADGTGMYQQPKDTTKYIGIAVNKETATESNNPSDYTWSKFKGEDGQSVSSLGRWHTGLIVPKRGIVTMGGSTFCAKKETANPPLWTTTTSDGRRITQTQDGGRTYGYILSGESNTEEYDLLVQNGKDGLSIVWKGDLQSPPSNPQINWAYRDTNNGRVYIWNGTAWSLMVVDGSDGADGAAGSNGLSVFITYNDSTSQPSVPTGNGTTGGWHTNATSGAIWMSQKVASSASDGTWGTPIKIKGDKGDSITAMGRWYTGLIVPKQGVVTMGGSSYIAKKETTNPPLWTVTTSSGQRIKQTQDGGKTYGYILSGEMNSAEYDLLASKGEDGKPGADGKQGIQGCIIRHSEWSKFSVQYRNDESLTSGTRYLDVALVKDSQSPTGWEAYKCKNTHTSSESNAPGTSGGSSYWEVFSMTASYIFTSLIIAKDASIDFMQGNQLLIKKDDGTVTAGLSGSIAGSKVRIWAGSATPDNAPFRVLESGKMIGTDVELTGTINAISGTFRNVSSPNGSFKIKENGDVELVGKISTSLNGTRIELDPSSNSIKMYNQNGSVIGEIMFMEEQWSGNVNYLPMVRLRNYHNSEEFGETILRAGSIIINDSSLGSDVYSCLINPSIGLAFSKNGVETKRYANK